MIVNVAVLSSHVETNEKLQAHQSMLTKEKKVRQSESKKATKLSEEKIKVESSLREERFKAEELQGENESLKANLQAKKEREAEAARLASLPAVEVHESVAAVVPAPAVQVSGDKQSWLAASGIPESEWQYVDFIVSKESGWNPSAVNASSGACGLGQQLPCGKWAGAWNDPVAALQAQHGYVKDRYGSYAGAVGFWQSNSWY